MIPYSFWNDVEKPLNHVLYSDTDSLFVHIPQEYNSVQETIDETTIIAENINEIIKNYFNSYLLTRLGVDPQYNETFFKTELTAESILFLDSKKNYALNITSKEGKIFEPPETNYTGISVVRSNTAPFTSDFIKYLVEDIALNKAITTKDEVVKELSQMSQKYFETLKKCIEDLDFKYVSVPCKWADNEYAKEPTQIIAMKLYNTITQTDTFRNASFGVFFPVKLENPVNFQNQIMEIKNKSNFYLGNITIDKVNYLALPYNYDKENVKQLMLQYGIKIETMDLWDKLVNKVAKRIIEVIKSTYKI